MEDRLPVLAPEDECVKGLPFSITVTVKCYDGSTFKAMYNFIERQWLEMPYETEIHHVTHWQSISPQTGKE